jgi:hypothetical protein
MPQLIKHSETESFCSLQLHMNTYVIREDGYGKQIFL